MRNIEASTCASSSPSRRRAAATESLLPKSISRALAERMPGSELSERELEVLKLIADGMSNAEMAAKLVLSEKTIKGHVSNILSKLHLADRTQAAVYAWRQGVVRKD